MRKLLLLHFTILLFCARAAASLVITNNVLIAPDNLTYDGQEVVISNAVVTVEGPHAFNNLHMRAGAVLTHSPDAKILPGPETWVTNEIRQLVGTNLSPLGVFVRSESVQVTSDANNPVTYTNGVDYLLIKGSGEVSHLQRTLESAIADGEYVRISYHYIPLYPSGLDLVISNDLVLEAGAIIRADGLGTTNESFAGNDNPLGGNGGSHGGYGGKGSDMASAVYGFAGGTALGPETIGYGGWSGSGGAGGLGGGRIRLRIGGQGMLGGLISANGLNATNSRAGGGAGGSLWITAPILTGTGSLSAKGGRGEPVHGGGGGGGRIMLELLSATNDFSGPVLCHGGEGSQWGGAGTYYLTTNALPGKLTFRNAGVAGAGTLYGGTSQVALEIAEGAGLTTFSTLKSGNVLVRSNSWVTTIVNVQSMLSWTIIGNAVFERGSKLSLVGGGFVAGSGPGAGGYTPSGVGGGGGGHGGSGGNGQTVTGSGKGGVANGDVIAARTVGSGGGGYPQANGGKGGGAVSLMINGNLQVDGLITVNGADALNATSGGGAGGSIYLLLEGFSGSGALTADGGNGGLQGGGGGGGRISINSRSNSFGGNITAFGGTGAQAGGAGSIYSRPITGSLVEMRYDNGGRPGASTTHGLVGLHDLTVTGGASVRSTANLATRDLSIGSNSSFMISPGAVTASNVFIAAGGWLNADVASFGSGTRPGASGTQGGGGGGGGHGGNGGSGLGASSFSGVGGTTYGSTTLPQSAGSIGGSIGVSTGMGAGSAGGALALTVANAFQLDGRLSADGGNATTNRGGGGSGGSILLTLNRFSGSGEISARGGQGDLATGGGGGGGRIAVYSQTNLFTGSYRAPGGAGYGAGGPGTIYLAPADAERSLIFDNDGVPGAYGVLGEAVLASIVVRSGTVITSALPTLSVNNFILENNARLVVRTLTMTVLQDAIISPGAQIIAENPDISTAGNGAPGNGTTTGGGGGGHGGYGGLGRGAQSGGNVYDSVSLPAVVGSRGGSTLPGNQNQAKGGGVFALTVVGALQLDGQIMANAQSGASTNSGGGAGGSIRLSSARFSGQGAVSADGGAGQLPFGGGGGGGRIAISSPSNSFGGQLSAKGGPGFIGGGAGTIYLKDNLSQGPDLIVDNGGIVGTNTLTDLSFIRTLTVRGGGHLKLTSVPTSLGDFYVGTNSSLLPDVNGRVGLSLSGLGVISNGGALRADGVVATVNEGAGGIGANASGGGGHGGYGGGGLSTNPNVFVPGGNAHDTTRAPNAPGSPGGQRFNASGGGGGMVEITGEGRLLLDGRISANGGGMATNNAGGGSGGSIFLRLGLSGQGAITADGGSGHLPNGGGGGGGRIYWSYFAGQPAPLATNLVLGDYQGTFSAKGGPGYQYGGAGTIYTDGIFGRGAVLVENGGVRGTNTLSESVGNRFHIVQGGAVLSGNGFYALLVRSNGWLGKPRLPGVVTVTRDAIFEAGGGIDLNGQGTATAGNGSSSFFAGGGGGHGGKGGLSSDTAGNAIGGFNMSFWDGGSAGGVIPPQTAGAKGGGFLDLNVGGDLVLNGHFSADGLDGGNNAGGGAGGGFRLVARTLTGQGSVSVRGGRGPGQGGGGGGGRIHLQVATNLFQGSLLACGGEGSEAGGAGTIFVRSGRLSGNIGTNASLILDNCGQSGAVTPLVSFTDWIANLTVTGGAIAELASPVSIFSNLTVSAGGVVTSRKTDTNLHLTLRGDLLVLAGGAITGDRRGFVSGDGPGAGNTVAHQGAGGGHGGSGGASASGAAGGLSYGSAAKPVEAGSGGGAAFAASEGGGVLRLEVARTLLLEGEISARGGGAVEAVAGGGAGGSIWLRAGVFTGQGKLAASGGDGVFFGGGGGGGRVAVYSATNTFTGTAIVEGGLGAKSGGRGSFFSAGNLLEFTVLSQTPTGVFSNAVEDISLEFSGPIQPGSLNAQALRIYGPNGQLDFSILSFLQTSANTMAVVMPALNLPGDYRVEVHPPASDLWGVPLSQSYTGSFTMVLPLISGIITNAQGLPVAGVELRASGGLLFPAFTDAEGRYSLGVPRDSWGTVEPFFAGYSFEPIRRGFYKVSDSLDGQNFLLQGGVTPSLAVTADASGLSLGWNAISGVHYQIMTTTNLVHWSPVYSTLAGTNGPIKVALPLTTEAQRYFRLVTED